MRTPHFGLRTTAKVAALAISCISLTAQVPENAAVVGTIAFNNAPGASGLFYVTLPTSQNPGGIITKLTGLPAELTVGPTQTGGAFSLVRRNSDGTLFVGDFAASGGTVHVHILKMVGAQVQSARKVPVGQVPSFPGNLRHVGGLALLPDGRVLVAASPFVSGPMAGWKLAILDDTPAVPTLTPIVRAGAMANPVMYDVALSPDGRTAYALNLNHLTSGLYPSLLYAVDLQTYATTLLHSWPSLAVTKLTASRDGTIYATGIEFVSSAPANPSIFEIRNKVVTTITGSTKAALTGLALERATGRFVFASASMNTSVNDYSVLTGDASGNLTVLARPPAGGWGFPMAIDVNDAFEPYGRTPNQQRHWFDEFPNPGGLPEIGNMNFSVTMRSTGNPSHSFFLIGLNPASVQVAGAPLLVLPAAVLGAPQKSHEWKLPIPNSAILRGSRLYMQGAHYGAGNWGTSRGLELVIQ